MFTPQKNKNWCSTWFNNKHDLFHIVSMFQNMVYMIDTKFYMFIKIIKNNVFENTEIKKGFNINAW